MAVTVDSHHHFWDTTNSKYDYYWMDDDLMSIQGKRRPKELAPWIEANGIQNTIVVQTIPSVDETVEFLQTAEATDFVAGVVGWLDLTDPGIDAALRELRSGPGGQYLVGIRHQVHDEADPDWLVREDVQRGIAAVCEADLVYDLLVRPRELPAAIKTVENLPEGRFVIDHIAKPNIKAGETEPWSGHMKGLAALSNVLVKVSGMITEADHYRWNPDELRPYVQDLLEWFGPSRLMFGSDWPVCTLAGTYTQVFEAAQFALGELNMTDRNRVFGRNAVETYKLNV